MKEICYAFVDEIEVATAHIELTDNQKNDLLRHFEGVLAKLIYAFIWQASEISISLNLGFIDIYQVFADE